MNRICLQSNIYLTGLFVSKNNNIMIAAYVDGCITSARIDQEIEEFVKKLEKNFHLKQLIL